MEVSKLINEGRNINKDRQIDLLRFIQDEVNKNYRFLKDTTATQICKCYCQLHPECSIVTIQAVFGRLLKKGIIVRASSGGYRYNFRINYLYPNLPAFLLENATTSDKEYVNSVKQKMEEKAKDGNEVSLTNDGAIVSKPVKPVEPEPVITSTPVEVTTDGKNLSLTITLNLNLNR